MIDQRFFWIPVTILGVIVAVAVVESLISVARQALLVKRRADAMQAIVGSFDVDALEGDVARIASAAVAGRSLASRATGALGRVGDAVFEWRATATRIRVLRDRARTLPELLNET